MNTPAELTFGRGNTEGLDSVSSSTAPSRLRAPRLAKVANAALKQSTTVFDCRIDSLMVLARALLHEIEFLKEQSATNGLPDVNLQAQVRRFEAELIRSALVRTGGRQRRAARLLGMKVTTLNTKIKRYRIRVDGEGDSPDEDF